MSGFVFAAPPVPPPAPVEAWQGLSVEWRGWDGSVWDLTDADTGVFLQAGGVEGLAMPPQTQWTADSPATHGQSYRGFVVNARPVFWPVFVYGASSGEWAALDRAFWRSLQPGKHGTWTVTTPDGEVRSLSCRFVDDGNHSFNLDPIRAGWAAYGVNLIADDPLWQGAPVRRTWAQSAPESFFGVTPVAFVVATNMVSAPAHGLAAGTPVRFSKIVGTTGITAGTTYYVVAPVAGGFQVAATVGGAAIDLTGVDGSGTLAYSGMPLLRVSSGSQLASAKMSNPGDLEAWPVWTVTGPVDSVTVGVDGVTVVAPITVAAGEVLVIDTDPAVQSAWLNGVDVTSQLGSADFAPIPAGEDRALSLSMVGSGSVQAEIRPRHFRAW